MFCLEVSKRIVICCYVSSTISSLILTSGFLTDDMH